MAVSVEIIDLDEVDRTGLMAEIAQVSAALKQVTDCDKLNVAAIGNIVPQLHVHVVARRTDDAAWPKPVWGAVPAKRLRGRRVGRFCRRAAARSEWREPELSAPRCAEVSAMRFSPRLPETRMPFRPDLGPKPHLGYTAIPMR